ncbi:BRO-N domain-containing protein [Cronobacter dublinensis]|nr:BRO family protein [Cronobacter dublinensis]
MLKHRNEEAPTTCDSRGSLSKKSSEGNIDMNIVATSDLNFHGITLQPVANLDGIWLTSSDIANALGYASSKSVSTIYSRNSDEFTNAMSMVIKMKTNGINNNLREKNVRVFSLRGCHLIAMFATTPLAKEFRRWVLDILDREVTANAPAPCKPSQRERNAYNVEALAEHYEVMYKAWRTQIEPALRAIESPLAGRLHDRFKDGHIFMSYVRKDADGQLLPGEEARIR